MSSLSIPTLRVGRAECIPCGYVLQSSPRTSKFCGRNRVDGAKPPQAGSHKSLMFLTESKELFYHKGCKFTFQGVDQTLRRPLTVLLFRNCCKKNCISKDNGQFQKAKLRRARRYPVLHSRNYYDPRVLRMTVGVGFVVTLSEAGVE